MAKVSLTKSYVNTADPDHPIQEDLILYQLFEKAREEGFVGEVVNLETGRRMSTVQILDKADEYAKGLIAIGFTPGDDTLTVIGCPTLEAAVLFTAAASIGIGFAHPFIYDPREKSLSNMLPLLQSKIVIVGEGAGGQTFSAFTTFFDDSETPTSSKFSFVEHVFYDGTYKDRSPTQKYIQPLDKLKRLGEGVTDADLQEAKCRVRPEFVLHHLFTSGSTGKPKCVAHTHRGLANELLQLRANNVEPTLTMNYNVDEMISYACTAWTLAGKISKTLLVLDLVEGRTPEDLAKSCVKGINEESVAHIALPGTVQQIICSYIRNNNLTIPRQKLFLNGAQIVSRQFKVDLMDIFKGIPFTAYGMCETFILAFTTLGDRSENQEDRLESKLYPKPNMELRLVNDENEVVDIGNDGEIQVKTYSFLKEYKSEEEKTRRLFTEDGFLRTGDMAVMYPDGTFIIKGRADDAIRFKVFGDVIYPGPIEEVVSKHLAVSDVSVIAGSRNDTLGDELTYCIRLEHEAARPSEEDLISYCFENGLDETHRPARIIYFDAFPTTANSRKVSKSLLRATVKQMIEADSLTGVTEWFKEFKAGINDA